MHPDPLFSLQASRLGRDAFQNISSIGDFKFELVVVSNSISLSENTFPDKRKQILIIMYLWYLITKD